jgi:hypothetical protein
MHWGSHVLVPVYFVPNSNNISSLPKCMPATQVTRFSSQPRHICIAKFVSDALVEDGDDLRQVSS